MASQSSSGPSFMEVDSTSQLIVENSRFAEYMDTTESTETRQYVHNRQNIRVNNSQSTPSKDIVLLNLTSRYAPSWGVWEGVRELIQNWHDGICDAVSKTAQQNMFCMYHKIEFQEIIDSESEVIYKAFMVRKAQEPESFGYMHYDRFGQRLTLVNQNVALERKILLLGYSNHSRHKDVIGQFGEGLKIGALSLVRQECNVVMKTNKEEWTFGLHPYHHFDNEEGLAVFVKTIDQQAHRQNQESIFQLGENDTSSSIYPLTPQEFDKCRMRFIFLTKPMDTVDTEMGTLLLDDRFAGQLYVKGIWVSDLRDDNLNTGVNFCELKIDRDRNAVPQLSEIDHKVSCMWPRALEQRRDLAHRYYNLLARNPNCRDVKHANTYAFTETTAALMAEQFRVQNPEAFPVMDSHSWQDLQGLQDELQRKVVSCNQSLLSLLHKSGRYSSLEDARTAIRAKKSDIKPLAKLCIEERSVLEHAIKLANLADPGLKISMVDVIDTQNEEKPMLQGERLEIPTWMLDLESVHKAGPVCFPHHGKCMCREIRICNSFLALRKVQGPGKHPREPPPDQALMKILSKYICRECDKTPKFCKDAPPAMDDRDLHTSCVETNQSLEREVQRLVQEHGNMIATHKSEMQRMKGEQDIIHKELQTSIAQEADPDMKIAQLQAQYEDEFDRYKNSVKQNLDHKESLILSRITEINDIRSQVEEALKKYQEQEVQLHDYNKCLEQRHSVMVEKITTYRKILSGKAHAAKTTKDKTQIFTSDLCKDVATTCHDICHELEGQAYLCTICTGQRRGYAFMPCGHYKYCEACAKRISETTHICAVCKQEIKQVVKVFE